MLVDRDFVKMTIRTGETSSAYCLSTNGRISSRPLVLLVLRPHNNCRISSTENVMYNIFGKDLQSWKELPSQVYLLYLGKH